MRARQKLGEILSAFEFLDRESLELTLAHLVGVRNPLPDARAPFYLLVETSGSSEEHDSEKLQASRPRAGLTRGVCVCNLMAGGRVNSGSGPFHGFPSAMPSCRNGGDMLSAFQGALLCRLCQGSIHKVDCWRMVRILCISCRPDEACMFVGLTACRGPCGPPARAS